MPMRVSRCMTYAQVFLQRLSAQVSNIGGYKRVRAGFSLFPVLYHPAPRSHSSINFPYSSYTCRHLQNMFFTHYALIVSLLRFNNIPDYNFKKSVTIYL